MSCDPHKTGHKLLITDAFRRRREGKPSLSGISTVVGFKIHPTIVRRCQWPLGDPKDANFHLCGKPAIYHRPYCDEHCQASYVNYGIDPRATVQLLKEGKIKA